MKPTGVSGPRACSWLLASGLSLMLAAAGPQAAPATVSDAAPEPAATGSPASDTAPERAALRTQLDAIQRLLTRLDELETRLIAQARQALDRADAAQDHDERARQERLYGEIGVRIAELRATRRDIVRQLQVLEQALDGSVTSQPTQPDR